MVQLLFVLALSFTAIRFDVWCPQEIFPIRRRIDESESVALRVDVPAPGSFPCEREIAQVQFVLARTQFVLNLLPTGNALLPATDPKHPGKGGMQPRVRLATVFLQQPLKERRLKTASVQQNGHIAGQHRDGDLSPGGMFGRIE